MHLVQSRSAMKVRDQHETGRQVTGAKARKRNTTNTKFAPTLPGGTTYKALQAAYRAIPATTGRPGDFSFTRGGVLSVELLTTFPLYTVADGNRYGMRHLLQSFWEDACDQGIDLPRAQPVSASAICQARQRLPGGLFRDLLSVLATQVTDTGSASRWRGRRVYAADGALVNVKSSPELDDEFGVAKNCYTPQVRLSVLVDVMSRMPVNYAAGGRSEVGEREQLFAMLPSLRQGDLLLLDRGYPSYEVLAKCAKEQIDFIVRCPTSQTFKFIDGFKASGATSTVIAVDLEQCDTEEAPKTRLRLVRCNGPAGPVIYITSLTASEATAEEIFDLYHLRWEVEEFFKLATSEYAGQKQFRSTSALGVHQEIGALVLYLAMTRVLACEAEGLVDKKDGQFVSQKGAVLALHRHLIGLLLDDDPMRIQARIRRAVERLQRTLDRRRPSRSYRRVSKKPRRKWGPRGKTRA